MDEKNRLISIVCLVVGIFSVQGKILARSVAFFKFIVILYKS